MDELDKAKTALDEFDEWLDKCPVDCEFQDEINDEGTIARFYLFRIPDDKPQNKEI